MKLKTLPITILATIAMFASCSSETPVGGEANRLQKGEPSYASFSLRLSDSQTTKAEESTSEEESTADASEIAVINAKVYIFSGGVLEVAASPEVAANVTVPIAVSTGEKTVYILTSESLNPSVVEESTLLSEFEEMLFDASRDKIAKENDFAMIGKATTTVVKNTQVMAAANPLAVSLDRATAKLQVKFDSSKINVASSVAASFSECKFAAAQPILKMQIASGKHSPVGELQNDATSYSGLEEVPENPSESFFTPAVAAFNPSFSANAYMGECLPQHPAAGNVTFALVRMKTVPTSIYNGKTLNSDGTFYALARRIAASATWIFAAGEDGDIIYFASESDAQTYLSSANLAAGYEVYEFASGFCYYRVNILASQNEDEKIYGVERNNYYRLNVTDIKGLGAPNAPGVVPEDPDTPIDENSYLACEITIVPYTVHDQDAVLK